MSQKPNFQSSLQLLKHEVLEVFREFRRDFPNANIVVNHWSEDIHSATLGKVSCLDMLEISGWPDDSTKV